MKPQSMSRHELIAEVERLRLKAKAHKRCLRDQGKALLMRNSRIASLEKEVDGLTVKAKPVRLVRKAGK